MSLDGLTLSIVTGVTCLVFALSTHVLAYLLPQEGHLRDWRLGSLLSATGATLVAVQGIAPPWLAPMLSNSLLVLGAGYVLCGLSGTFGHPRMVWLPWAGFMLSLLPQFWFTYITPSLAGRLATMSLFYAPGTAYGAYLCWRQALQEPTRSLRLIQLVSTALLGAGAVIFVVRLGLALSLSAGPVTAERRFMILVLPNFWGVLFNIWLPLALSLFLSARLRVFAQRSREQAEAASAARTRFLATMSHEIRTPLNGILGMAQLLLRHHLTREERDQSVEAIVRSGRKLLGVLDGVIDLARTDAGRLSLEKRSFHPSALVAEVHARFAPEAQAKGLRLESAWEGAPLADYQGDPVRLGHMLGMLVDNAIKFTHTGFVRIEARGREKDAYRPSTLEFSVRDSGIGIAPGLRERLFQSFSLGDDSSTRRFGGSGLGLAIVGSFAQHMGGEVGVESEHGRGSWFWFRVPATRNVGVQAAVYPSTQAPAGPPKAASGSLRVLVADDNAINRQIIVAQLRSLGHFAEAVADGERVLSLLSAASPEPDVILLDLHMPVLDGIETARRIRAREAASGRAPVPLLALTASVDPEDSAACLAAGMDGVLAKPITQGALQEALMRHARGVAATMARPSIPVGSVPRQTP